MIPLKYNLRNLRVRWVNTAMTVFGTGLVVWSSCILFMLVEGLNHSLDVSGDPLGMIILRKGSTNETNGGFDAPKADDVATLSGIATVDGQAMVAKEMLNIAIVARTDGTRANLIVRGISSASPKLRPNFEILPNGRMFEPGRGEMIVSKSLAGRFEGATIGGTLKLGDRESYRVVGVFSAGGSSAESEVWVDLKDMERALNRQGFVSSVHLRAQSKESRDAIKKTIENTDQFKLAAITEAEYYESQSRDSLLFRVGGTLVAIFLTFGAMFASANTMFAAVKSRTREIGTLRALGFSRSDVLFSFLGESLILCLMGGVLGLLATIPLNALTFNTSLGFAAAAINFRFGPLVLLVSTAMTLSMGVFGGLFPALRAVRLDVVHALREV